MPLLRAATNTNWISWSKPFKNNRTESQGFKLIRTNWSTSVNIMLNKTWSSRLKLLNVSVRNQQVWSFARVLYRRGSRVVTSLINWSIHWSCGGFKWRKIKPPRPWSSIHIHFFPRWTWKNSPNKQWASAINKNPLAAENAPRLIMIPSSSIRKARFS
jgi:hypothetical protein